MVRDRIGIGVSGTAVRAVLIRRTRLAWKTEVSIEPERDVRSAIGTALRAIPRRRFGVAATVGAVLGPATSQVKCVTGIAGAANVDVVTRAVQLNVRRFFVQPGPAMVVTRAVRRGDQWWIATMESAIMASVAAACKAERLRLVGCAPVVAVLGSVVEDGRFAVRDGQVTDEVTVERGACVHTARRLTVDAEGPVLRRLHGIDLDDVGPEFADALAAAQLTGRSPLAVDPGHEARSKRQHRAVRTILGAVAAAAASVAIAGPTIRAIREERRAAERLGELAASARPVLDAMSEIQAASDVSRRVGGFAASRRSVSALMRDIARVLPDSATIVTLRVDSLSASVITLSPPGAAVVAALGHVAGVLQASVTGTVTRETVGNATWQRTSVALRLAPASQHRAPGTISDASR